MNFLFKTRFLEIVLLIAILGLTFTHKIFVEDRLEKLYSYKDTVDVGVLIYDTLNQPLPKHVNSFLNKHLRYAQRMQERTGFPASVAIAQGMLESNFGRSSLSKRANNYHGIVYCKRADGAVVIPDGTTRKKIKWSSWKSVANGWKAYFEMMNDPDWIFKHRWEKHINKENYFELIVKSIAPYYAEDPQYAHKLIDLEKRYKLTQYDR